MFSFYYRTERNRPSRLYSMCMMGLEWWVIYYVTDTFYMSMIRRVPDLKPAAKNMPLGLAEIHRQGSFYGYGN